MIEKLKAKGIHILISRDPSLKERGGLIIPDSSRIKPNTGKILSVGKLVPDKGIKEGDTAIFNKTSGFTLEFPDGDVLVLRESDVIASIQGHEDK